MNGQAFFSAVLCWLLVASASQSQDLSGLWDAAIDCPGGSIRFGLDLKKENQTWSGYLVNGPERIRIPVVDVAGKMVTLKIDHFDSVVELKFTSGSKGIRAVGTWKKRRGPSQWLTMNCTADPHAELKLEEPIERFLGRWAVDFSSGDDPAVAIFKKAEGSNRVLGTFMTTTGDYRFLDGFVKNEMLQLSCFDGAHAFLFHAKLDEKQTLEGDFWSSSTWHETWNAKLDANAKLPDEFLQTTINDEVDFGELSFPDLDGNSVRLNDPRFAGKARIIYVFGSWCPNCHDAGDYFAELDKKYAAKGLSILGLAFEHTGEFKRDAAQVRKYLDRHESSYPVLVAGLSDKTKASESLPILDRVRSYPTTLFLDRKGNVTAVHTGFTGPATGLAYEQLKEKFEKIIVENLSR